MCYDKFACQYDALLAPFESRFLGRWRRETLALLPTDARILEIGAGTGANVPFYPPAELAVTSEFAIGMIGRAREKSEHAMFVQADGQELPFDDQSFDAAFATLVFCAVPDPMAGFAEIRRVVKKGGTVVLLEHVRPPGLLGPAFDAFNFLSSSVFNDCFNRRTAPMMREAGFDVLEVRQKLLGIVNLIIARN